MSSSPDLDGLDYETLILLLLEIYNDMFKKSDFPKSWKKSYIHMINKTDGKNFAPQLKLLIRVVDRKKMRFCRNFNQVSVKSNHVTI
ncbi:hypothetical protein TSAR_012363 [Trichomalopsis sarcophagae]|uniref:Uncharacterized protein n=1 Tax=Trichomalopsis sarcophagae TaxID=543379 RepID=A0A232EDQ0_9HYME|nr:hypothetical protein TSAR_012363 [Trichomalopsis sarcophagae]